MKAYKIILGKITGKYRTFDGNVTKELQEIITDKIDDCRDIDTVKTICSDEIRKYYKTLDVIKVDVIEQ